MDTIIVRFIKLFSGLFRRQGVDADRLFDIVETKIKMDKRRVHLQFRQSSRQKNENANRMNLVFFLYAIFSFFISTVIFQLQDIVMAMILFHSYLLFMMAMTLITDFSSVLLDTTDNMVILPRPVSGKTLFASRMVHIFVYLLQFGIAICTLPVIVTFINFGVAAGLFSIITSFSTILLSVFITYLLYLLILRFSSERKLREIVTYFQVFMAIVFTAGYQVVPRFMDMAMLEASYSLQWYSYLAPPVWMAVALESVQLAVYDLLHIVMIILSVTVPVLLFWLVNKYFAPAFSRKLAAVQDDGATEKKLRPGQKQKRSISENISPIVCRSATEKAGFEITWKISGRDKQFRLQFYPVIGYMAVLIFVFVFRNGSGTGNVWEGLYESKKFLWFIYIPLFTISSSLSFISFNENHPAAWVYYNTPLRAPGNVITGSLKALLVKFFLPVFIALFFFCLAIWGTAIIDDFIFGLLVNINAVLIMATLSRHYLPFSQPPNVQQQSGKFIQVILLFILMAILIGLHWLGLRFPIALYVSMPVTAITAWLLIRNLQRLSWAQITI